MESFIVRIYRRPEPEGPGPVGTVEVAATGQRVAFHNPEELLAALENPASRRRGRARQPRAKR
ncbi:MAG: hypothetical protein JNM76_02610 [Betaproteobacteria bacterium]|nr:hypothetical protein [Betaproteobacteria bacterium]